MGMAATFETRGNDDAYIILHGDKSGSNYGNKRIETACAALRVAELRRQVMADCSHANSSKSHGRQTNIAQDLARQLSRGRRRIVGVMVRSNLKAGHQDLKPGVSLKYGVSITDAYPNWIQTEPVSDIFAETVWHRHAYSYDG